MFIEYCRPSWPGKHYPTPWKAQKTQKRFLIPLFLPTDFGCVVRENQIVFSIGDKELAIERDKYAASTDDMEE